MTKAKFKDGDWVIAKEKNLKEKRSEPFQVHICPKERGTYKSNWGYAFEKGHPRFEAGTHIVCTCGKASFSFTAQGKYACIKHATPPKVESFAVGQKVKTKPKSAIKEFSGSPGFVGSMQDDCKKVFFIKEKHSDHKTWVRLEGTTMDFLWWDTSWLIPIIEPIPIPEEFKVGDRIRIINEIAPYGSPSGIGWVSPMDEYIGQEDTIRLINSSGNGHKYVLLKNIPWNWDITWIEHLNKSRKIKLTKKTKKLMTITENKIEEALLELGEKTLNKYRVEMDKVSTETEKKLVKLRELENYVHPKIELKFPDGTKVFEELTHAKFTQVLNLSYSRHNVLLVGMAGVGKTKTGEQIAKALELPFYSMSVCSQTSKSDIVGYMNAAGNYIKTHFRDAYENGGVFLMDEIDAGNANVLVQINSALSNGYCPFPDKMVHKHENFIFLGSANTYGNGASRQYVGRNQLDAATLDRFTIVNFDLDEQLEQNLARKYKHGLSWLEVVKAARQFVNKQGLTVLITPRATMKGSMMLEFADPVTVAESILLNVIGHSYKDAFFKHIDEVLKKVKIETPLLP